MISAVVLTKNEEENIVDCLESLSFAGEILVIDDDSDDRTAELAKLHGAKVISQPLNNDFSKLRNFALKNAKGEWVLFVDADERVSKQLASEIKTAVSKDSEILGYRILRQEVLWGKKMVSSQDRFHPVRLAKKGAGRWVRSVHEEWEIKGPIGQLSSPLTHLPHQTLREFVKEIDFYSTLHAKALSDEGKRPNVVKIVVWPIGKFLENFLFRKGFLDGGAGFIVSAMMSFHSFLAWSKLWLMQKKS